MYHGGDVGGTSLGIFPLEWGLNGHWGHVLLRPSVSHLTMTMLYNLSKPQDCPSIDLIKFAKCIHSPVPATR